MTVVQQGQVNTTSLVVPDVVVQIVPPQQNYVNGVATNILGLVGTASWGPVNSPTVIGDIKSYAATFGNIQPRKYDMGTAAWAAILNGANNMRCVRVTDGSDTAATANIGTSGVTITSRYTGSLGNGIAAMLTAGTASGSWRVTITLPGLVPEVFDNIAAGLSGNAVWVAMATAINNGISGLRGPSQIVVATAGTSTALPATTTAALSVDQPSGQVAPLLQLYAGFRDRGACHWTALQLRLPDPRHDQGSAVDRFRRLRMVELWNIPGWQLPADHSWPCDGYTVCFLDCAVNGFIHFYLY